MAPPTLLIISTRFVHGMYRSGGPRCTSRGHPCCCLGTSLPLDILPVDPIGVLTLRLRTSTPNLQRSTKPDTSLTTHTMAGLKLNTQTVFQNVGAPKSAPVVARPEGSAPQSGDFPVLQIPPPSHAIPQSHKPPHHQHTPAPATAASPSSSQQPKPQTTNSTTSQPPAPPPAATPAADDPYPPPVSPITPPLHPLKSTTPIPPPLIPPNFASLGGSNRGPPLTHASHPATVPSAPAPALVPLDPVDFEDNADVIALRATIGILLQQKKRAEQDIRTLRDAKNAAIARPLDFVRDLTSGRVSQGGGGGVATEEADDEDSDAEDEDDDVTMKTEGSSGQEANALSGLKPSAMRLESKPLSPVKGKAKASASAASASDSAAAAASPQPPWVNLPKPQDIARCPAINWAQYAVQGEALDRLHNEQLSRPSLGAPAQVATNGTYHFAAGASNPDDGRKIEGIAAPFDPLRDGVAGIRKEAPTTAKGGGSASHSAPRRAG